MRATIFPLAIIGMCCAGAMAVWAQDKPPLYYQDPDGKPFYATTPRKMPDGRTYKPVFADRPVAPPKAPPTAPANAHRILYYRNPMGLADTSPTPKKDQMGMDYLPVYADDAAPEDPPGTLRISPGRLQTLGVRTALVELRPAAARAIRATGILQFDERHLATITTKVPGWITKLLVDATGDPVRRGQVLAEIYAPDLAASEAEYLVAGSLGGAMGRASVERLRALDIPEDEIARLRRTGRPSRNIAVLAPEDGVVIDKLVQLGMKIGAGEALYKTANLADMWLLAQVQEQDVGAVQLGAPVQANFVAFPGKTFHGKVDFIYPDLAADTRTARVRIVLPNPDGALRAAMFASVVIDAPADGPPVLSVPESAILDSGTRQVVLVARGAGRFMPQTVQLGLQGDGWVQVRNGLHEQEQVVVGANFLIDAESNLRAALQGFAQGAKP